ncbi:MAG: hypothetical protein EZS28_019936 [Streblomastix strix]|uniref:Uncharacterized protein n=1 Tax=Streblomastix strix TaxID=222440 RepID=A0A5J4VPP6_9EUKA|nr:MAG: hypothetical protein EZS28_019936 [Streblomastix strix]
MGSTPLPPAKQFQFYNSPINTPGLLGRTYHIGIQLTQRSGSDTTAGQNCFNSTIVQLTRFVRWRFGGNGTVSILQQSNQHGKFNQPPDKLLLCFNSTIVQLTHLVRCANDEAESGFNSTIVQLTH